MKISKYISLALVALFATSCNEGLMDDINKNNGQPSADVVDGKFALSGAILSTGFSTVSGDYAFYTSSYTEQEFGTGMLQMAKAEVRSSSETAASSTFNNVWNSTYSTLRALKEVIAKCDSGGVNVGQHDVLGIAQTLTALNLGVLTDMHGDVPYSEALQGQTNLTPALDSQEAIYKQIFSLLDQAISNFSEAKSGKESNVGSQDILFNNDNGQWLGFAYALKARYKLHTQFRNQNAVAEALEAAEAAEAAGFSGAELSVFDDNNNNPWTAFFWSREYTASSKTVADLFEERNDPRRGVYVCNFFGYDDVGTPGNYDQAMENESLAAPAWLDNASATVHLFSESEFRFILAECKARLGRDASSDFVAGVKASFADYANADAGITGFSAETADAYAASRPVTLKEIFVQKYLAQARDEQVETYNDIRRCKAIGEEYIKLTNVNNGSGQSNAWPLRLPYGESDVRSNPNVRSAFGTGSSAGNYVFTENVWWAGGSR